MDLELVQTIAKITAHICSELDSLHNAINAVIFSDSKIEVKEMYDKYRMRIDERKKMLKEMMEGE